MTEAHYPNLAEREALGEQIATAVDATTMVARQFLEGFHGPVGPEAVAACQRHLDDLERIGAPDFPYYFDPMAIRAFEAFCLEYIRHPIGDLMGQPLVLMPVWIFIMGCILGWRRASDGSRRFSLATVIMGKGGAKTLMTVAFMLWGLVMEGEGGRQLYNTANDEQQAGKLFEYARNIISLSDSLRGLVDETTKKSIYCPGNKSVWGFSASRGASSKAKDGGRGFIVAADEFAEDDNGDAAKRLWSGSVTNTKNRLFIRISTSAATGTKGWGPSQYGKAVDILDPKVEGITPEDVPNHFLWVSRAVNRALDLRKCTEAELTDALYEANPHLNYSVQLTTLLEEWREARVGDGEDLDEFGRAHLNHARDPSSQWLPTTYFDDAADSLLELNDYIRPAANRAPVVLGYDGALRHDQAVLVMVLVEEDPPVVFSWCWMPQRAVERLEKEDRQPYQRWIREGHVLTTPGSFIRDRTVRAKIDELDRSFDILEIRYDESHASGLMGGVEEDLGISIEAVPQTLKGLNEGCRGLEELAREGRWRHPGNPNCKAHWTNTGKVTDRDTRQMRPCKIKGKRNDFMSALVTAFTSDEIQALCSDDASSSSGAAQATNDASLKGTGRKPDRAAPELFRRQTAMDRVTGQDRGPALFRRRR